MQEMEDGCKSSYLEAAYRNSSGGLTNGCGEFSQAACREGEATDVYVDNQQKYVYELAWKDRGLWFTLQSRYRTERALTLFLS